MAVSILMYYFGVYREQHRLWHGLQGSFKCAPWNYRIICYGHCVFPIQMTMSIIDFPKVWSWCMPCFFLFLLIVSKRQCSYLVGCYFKSFHSYFVHTFILRNWYIYTVCIQCINTPQLFKLGSKKEQNSIINSQNDQISHDIHKSIEV